MKRLMIIAIGFLLSFSVKAQEKMEAATDAKTTQPSKKDCIMMKEGKMMMMKGGTTVPMDQDMMLSDGTMVSMDGTVKMKDGKIMTMKDGDKMSMEGKMIHMDSEKKSEPTKE